MTRLPWRTERDALGVEDVAALVREQFGVEAASVAPLAAGFDSEAFVVDGNQVFRFPKRPNVVPHLESELAVLPLLAPRLPLEIPHPEFVGEACERFPFPFMGYRMLPGTPAEDAEGVDVARVLEQVVDLLGVLHAVELTGPVARVKGWDDGALQSEAYVHRLELGDEPMLRCALDWLAGRPLRTAGERVLLHADLGFEHVLIDPSDSRVTGVIDWGDLAIGERARDFVGAFMYAGVDAVERVLERSDYPATSDLVEDARTRVVHQAVEWWCEAVEFSEAEGTAEAERLLDRFLS